MRELYTSKANRDGRARELKASGYAVKRGVTGAQRINPKYIRDSGCFGISPAFGDELESFSQLYSVVYFDEAKQGWQP